MCCCSGNADSVHGAVIINCSELVRRVVHFVSYGSTGCALEVIGPYLQYVLQYKNMCLRYAR